MGQANDSILQSMPADRAQANQGVGKVPKPILASQLDTPSRKLVKSTVENGQQAKQNQRSSFLIQENSKPQDLIVYADGSVTKDQSGWRFTVKQGATTIHEDSAAYTVSTSSFTMELEAVTRALHWVASRGDSQTTHAIILTE